MAPVYLKVITNLVPQLLNIPFRRMWYSYDEEADVLYLNFRFFSDLVGGLCGQKKMDIGGRFL